MNAQSDLSEHRQSDIGNSRPIETSFESSYMIQNELGQGGFGTVYKGICKNSSKPVAVKNIPKDKITSWIIDPTTGEKIPKEVYFLREVQHIPGIIKLWDYRERFDSVLIVLEYVESSMDLFDFISKEKVIPEPLAKHLFSQILNIILKCRAAGIAHRDIKDENLILNTETREIKLIDFGAAAHIQRFYKDLPGTKEYAPPEWYKWGKYKPDPATVWSLGILLFDMVMGDIPFTTESEIRTSNVKFTQKISSNCKAIINKCLEKRLSKRILLSKIRHHAWLANTAD